MERFVGILCFLCLTTYCLASSIVAIDFGNEWLKIAVINAKAPTLLDIAINDQSNRKTPTFVGFEKDGEQVHGEAAQSLYYRNPSQVVASVKRLLGHGIDSDAARAYQKEFFIGATQQKLLESNRKSVAVSIPGQSEPVIVEELVGLLFQGVRQVATNHAKAVGIDSQLASSVVVVPDFFSESQKSLITQLGNLGGLAVTEVLGDLTAVAIDYGVRLVNAKNAESQPLHVYFYGMGAYGVSASLVRYSYETATSDSGNDHLTIEKLAAAYSPNIGGSSFDSRVRDELVKHFDSKAPKGLKSVSTSARAMAKLTREAKDAKEQLSVSPVITVQLDELFESLPIRVDITKEQLEAWTSDLVEPVVAPFRQVVEAGRKLGVTAADVELFGGGLRIPYLFNHVKQAFPSLNFGRHVDGDEAAVLGAGYYAAVTAGTKADSKGHKLVAVRLVDSTKAAAQHGLVGELSASQFSAALARLTAWTTQAAERQKAGEAKNRLEAYVNEVKEMIDEKKLKKASVQSQLEGATGFLESSSTSASHEDFERLRSELEEAVVAAKPTQKKAAVEEEVSDLEASRSARRRKEERAYARKQAEKMARKSAQDARKSGKPKPPSMDDLDDIEVPNFELPDASAKPKEKPTKAKSSKASKRKDDL